MPENNGISMPGGIFRRIKAVLLFILKAVYLAPFFVFGLWLLSAVYLPGVDLKASLGRTPQKKGEGFLDIISPKKEAVPRDHFHMIDDYIRRKEPHPPICVVCHGTYAHGKEKRVRALLNMHTGFIACAVCHARQAPEGGTGGDMTTRAPLRFMWVDRETGEIKATVKGEYGRYPATIYPIKGADQGAGRIFEPIKAEAAQQFLKIRPQLTPDQVSEAKAKLHAALSKKAVTCADCHRKNGYLDFKSLGFPDVRVDDLVSSEIVGMIDKYKEFHLPEVIDFSGE